MSTNVTGWLHGAYTRSKTAASVLLLGADTYECLTSKVNQLEGQLQVARAHQINYDTHTAQNNDSDCSQHICASCQKPSHACVSLVGTSVDAPDNKLGYIQETSLSSLRSSSSGYGSDPHDPHSLSMSVSETSCLSSANDDSRYRYHDQPETKHSTCERCESARHGSFALPDLLTSMAASPAPQAPPPPPPPPPPVLPLNIKTNWKTQLKSHKEEVKKKRRSTGGAPMPEITTEVLQSIKLRKADGGGHRGRATFKSPKPNMTPNAPPTVSLAALQNVSLKKRSQVRRRLGSPDVKDNDQPSTSAIDPRSFLKRTRLQRSPGGTPMRAKRKSESGTSDN